MNNNADDAMTFKLYRRDRGLIRTFRAESMDDAIVVVTNDLDVAESDVELDCPAEWLSYLVVSDDSAQGFYDLMIVEGDRGIQPWPEIAD